MLNETQMRQEKQEKRDEERETESRKNRGFIQVYEPGWRRLQDLIKTNPNAARLYALLAEHIDGAGVVVASYGVLAQMLGVSMKTIQRRAKELDDAGALVRIPVGPGGVYAYALHPEEVWKAWDVSKETAAFYSRTLVSKGGPEAGTIHRKLMTMMERGKSRTATPLSQSANAKAVEPGAGEEAEDARERTRDIPFAM